MSQKEIIINSPLRYSPGIDMDLDTASPNPDGGLPKPGDAFEHGRSRMGESYDQRGFRNLSPEVMPKKADIMTGDCNYGMISHNGSGRIRAMRVNSRVAPVLSHRPGTGVRG